MKRLHAIMASLLISTVPAASPAQEWHDFAGDKAARRYTPLDQINASNATRMKVAWQRPALAPELAAQDPKLRSTGYFKSTPLMIDGRLYAQNAIGQLEAFDPGTGATIWTQEGFAGDPLNGSGMRGIAYVKVKGAGRLLAVRDKWLYAVDMAGRIVRDFGEGGRVDLSRAMAPRGNSYSWAGAPQVCGGVVALGATMTDFPVNKLEPVGVVQAFDVATGKPRWTFSPVPRAGDPMTKTWENNSWEYTGETNVWAPMSSDEKLGLLFLPTASPTNDMYGGHRLGNNNYSDSLVALKCGSGTISWHYQFIHHDLWDLDLNSAPMLVDIPVAGKPVKAVVQLTKWGQPFAFERATGKPIWKIEERPVPQATTPGERTSPTQPFPVKPAPYDIQSSTPENLIDFTPELRAEGLAFAKDYVTGPLYTPPPVEGLDGKLGGIQTTSGGSSWAGGAFDPDTGILYVPSITRTIWASIIPGNPAETDFRYKRSRRNPILGPQGLPITKPPYGRVTALDLKDGDTRWIVANADGPRDHPALKGLDVPPLGVFSFGMPLLTKSLLFVALGDQAAYVGRTPDGKIPLGEYFDDSLRAYDKATGAVLASIKLPSGATGGIISYMYRGKQYIVVPTGGLRKPAGWIAVAIP
jgi:quinoprotein glucose dehydrogenase